MEGELCEAGFSEECCGGEFCGEIFLEVCAGGLEDGEIVGGAGILGAGMEGAGVCAIVAIVELSIGIAL